MRILWSVSHNSQLSIQGNRWARNWLYCCDERISAR